MADLYLEVKGIEKGHVKHIILLLGQERKDHLESVWAQRKDPMMMCYKLASSIYFIFLGGFTSKEYSMFHQHENETMEQLHTRMPNTLAKCQLEPAVLKGMNRGLLFIACTLKSRNSFENPNRCLV